MWSLILSTIAYPIAAFFIKRKYDAMNLPTGMIRNTVVFSLALAVSYGVSMVVDKVTGQSADASITQLAAPGMSMPSPKSNP